MLQFVEKIVRKILRNKNSVSKARISPPQNPPSIAVDVPDDKKKVNPDNHFFIVFSYKNGHPKFGLPENIRDLEKYKTPLLMTLGFRKIFWKVFKNVYSIQGIYEPLRCLETDLVLRDAYIFLTYPANSLLENHSDFLVVFSIESIEFPKEDFYSKMQSTRQSNGLSEQDLIELFNQSIAKTPYYQLANFSFLDFPGCGFFTQPYPEGSEVVFPFLYAFYYYGFLLCNRLERQQVDIKLDLSSSNSDQSLRLIADNRIRLVNIQRYFLTFGRSNIESIKEAGDLLRDNFSLLDRYERHLDINNSFEKHLANVSLIAESEKSQIFNLIAALLTFLGVPLATFSALMSASLDAAIIVKPEKLWSDHKFLIAAIISFLIPSSLIFIGFTIDFFSKLIRRFNEEI
jgi:hypothetical protein